MDNLDLRNMLYTAQLGLDGPIAIRYPRGYSQETEWERPFERIFPGKARVLKEGDRIAILSAGPLGQTVRQVLPETASPEAFGHFDIRSIKPLDTGLLDDLCARYQHLVTLEDGCLAGGFGSAVLEYLSDQGHSTPVTRLGIADSFVSHGTPEELYASQGLDHNGLLNTLNNLLHGD
jgi:1-deoxy-D-xylulose-5-phosphate synthase